MDSRLQAISELSDEVLEVWKDQIGTHYDGCYVRHVACFAVYVKHIANREESN